MKNLIDEFILKYHTNHICKALFRYLLCMAPSFEKAKYFEIFLFLKTVHISGLNLMILVNLKDLIYMFAAPHI